MIHISAANPAILSCGESFFLSPEAPAAQKTVLVVDDDPDVLRLVSALLRAEHYTVLTADKGSEAVKLSLGYTSKIDLLLSDFQMPEMTGVDLATQLTLQRPEIKVLLMSGFPGGMLVLNEGWHFLAKPFIASQLRVLVLGILGVQEPSRFQPGGSGTA